MHIGQAAFVRALVFEVASELAAEAAAAGPENGQSGLSTDLVGQLRRAAFDILQRGVREPDIHTAVAAAAVAQDTRLAYRIAVEAGSSVEAVEPEAAEDSPWAHARS